jgi:hypothetical protein
MGIEEGDTVIAKRRRSGVVDPFLAHKRFKFENMVPLGEDSKKKVCDGIQYC